MRTDSSIRSVVLMILPDFMKRMRLAVFVLVCTFPALMLNGQSSSSAKQRMESVEENLARYVALSGSSNERLRLASQMAALHVPAVSLAAIHDGRIDWAQAYGVSSLGGAPATTKTLFGAASISKTVTAMGVLKLVEEHRIDLDSDANRYLKRWKIPDNNFTAEKKVTVRELLNHTSGIGTHNGDIYDPSQTLPTLLQMLDGEKPARNAPVRVEAVPGTGFAYSNGGYMVLDLLVEDVTGETFARYMKRNVLDPIGMRDSTFDAPLPPEYAARAATPYWEDGKTPTPPAKFVEPNLAAGGLWTTPTDLAKFLIEVQREYAGTSNKVLSQSTMRLMLTPGLGPAPKRRWGLGFEVGGDPGNLYVRHEGSGVFEDDMVAYLRGNGIVVMTSGGDGGPLTEEILRSAGRVYGFPDFKPVEHSTVAVSPENLRRFIGTYGYVKVAMDGNALTAEIPVGSTPKRLYPESQTHYFVLDGPQELSFDVDAQQVVTGVEFITPMGHHSLEKSKKAE
jgi:CubicO group peptidase (beta-lactamase class C family)